MSSYWSLFPDFDHNPKAPIKDEFERLAKLKGWTGKSKQKKEKRNEEWGKCLNSDFEQHYGRDASKLEGWQSLCREVGLDIIPVSVKQCKLALKGTVFVNIVDLIDCRRTGAKVKRFKTRKALSKYTRSEGKIFPKKRAKADGFLTGLLIVLK